MLGTLTMLSKKDLIETNKIWYTGKISNQGSLEFAVSQVNRSKNWLRVAAVLTRAILIDHIFEDGNKRTASTVIAILMRMHGIEPSEAAIYKMVITIAKKNIKSITTIERLITHVRT